MPETAVPTFDPIAYKQTTTEQWQEAAEAWHRWGAQLEGWLGEATEDARPRPGRPGDRVLDVAAGAGGQSLAAARRVGPEGAVLATDIASNILACAEREALTAGLTNVAPRVMDGEEVEVDEGAYDAVISRVGLIYFPDQQRALQGMRRALRPGGRVAAIVYSAPERNEFFSIPVLIIRRRAQLPPPAPGQPAPFSLGADGVLAAAYRDAGFREVETRLVTAPLRLPSAAECVRFERESFEALHQMLAGLDQAAARRRGRRSRRSSAASRGRTGSRARASSSSRRPRGRTVRSAVREEARGGRMGLSGCKVEPTIAVSDMARAREFYEGKLALTGARDLPDGGVRCESREGTQLHI